MQVSLKPKLCSALFVAFAVIYSSLGRAAENQVVGGSTYRLDAGRWFLIEGETEWELARGSIRIRFRVGTSGETITTWAQEQDLEIEPLGHLSALTWVFRYDDSVDPIEKLTSVLGFSIVESAYPDTYLKYMAQPADNPYYSAQWNLPAMRMPPTWEMTTGNPQVTIAVIDGGAQYDHEDLAASTWSNPNEIPGDLIDNDNDASWATYPLVDDIVGWDFVDNDPDPKPGKMYPSAFSTQDLHGTACAGIIGGAWNTVGIAGVAPQCKLLHVRAERDSHAAMALKYCRHKGVDVVSISFQTAETADSLFKMQADSAYAEGIVVIAAVGNNGVLGGPPNVYPKYPATHPKVIGVGAIDDNDVRMYYSAYGAPGVDLMAPGGRTTFAPIVEMWTTDNDGTFGGTPGTPYYGHNPGAGIVGCPCPADNPKYYKYFNGTSASCPEVAGIVGLLLSLEPWLSNVEVWHRLRDAAVDLGASGYDYDYGHGKVDAYRTLTRWGSITANTTWGSATQPSTIYVSGDVNVIPGVTLTIMPETTIRIANDDDLEAGSDTARVEINIQGTLIANGTAVKPIIFERWGTSGDWAGIYLDGASGGGEFDHCQISHAETALESYALLTLTNSMIYDCGSAGVVSMAGGALVQNCQFNNPGHIGIDLQSDEAVVRNTIVDSAVDYAVRVFPSTVTTLELRTSQFNNSGIGLFVDGNATVDVDSACFFYQNDTGIHLYDVGSAVTIRDCGITWNPSGGIVCDGTSAPLIEANIFAHNGGGIYCSNASLPRIQGNQIQSHGNAITVSSNATPDLGHSSPSGGQSTGDNKISNASKYVVNNTSSTIYAQHNCWGTNSGGCNPATNKFTGAVDRSNPICCSFPPFSHGEGEPSPGEGFVYQTEPTSSREPEKQVTTGLVAIVPNPFNPNTTIRYSLGSQARVEINIYDVGGRLVRALANETQIAGQHALEWKGTDRAGTPAASGIYFVRMVANGETFTRKMTLLK